MSREEGLYKDKIEVSLDGRQIFYLFFGGSVIVGLVFVLGVMVGRRVEARGHVERAQTQATVDPLAALDRLEGGGLSYQGALRGGDAPASDVEKTIGEMAKHQAQKPTADKKTKEEPKQAEVPKPEPKAEIKEPTKPEAKKDEAKKDEAKAEAKKDEAKPEPKPEKKTRFALQLSSFQDKAEAQAYLEQVKGNGLPAYVTEAEVDGKTFYRVRVGRYLSIDAASDAKVDIDKATKKSATVVKLAN
jgi:septal ring-binding cell division protein DamX